jgi:hypothetical protein
MYEKLREEYNTACGPLTLYSNKCEDKWAWGNMPWPWELCAD